jgi:hypothetical protein
MRQAVTAAFVSFGILAGISGSARAQFNPCPLYSVIGADGVCQYLYNQQENDGGIFGGGGFRSATPPAAMGTVCVGAFSGIWYRWQPTPVGSSLQALTPWHTTEPCTIQTG